MEARGRLSKVCAAAFAAALLVPVIATASAARRDVPLQIVFVRSKSQFTDSKGSLYVMNADGTGERLLVANADMPAVSRDARSIAFVRGGEIWTMSRDGSGQVQVTHRPAGWHAASDPAWSPDGGTIYFARGVGPEGESPVFAIRRDGTGLHELTGKHSCDYRPSVSADGRVVVFGRILGDCVHGDEGWIRGANTTTGRIVRRFPFRLPDLWLYDPQLSADGTKLAYTSICDVVNTLPGTPCYGLFASGVDGSRPKRLIWSASFGNIDTPAWSPDGTQLAFEVGGRIWTISSAGTERRRLTSTKAFDSTPAWLPPAG